MSKMYFGALLLALVAGCGGGGGTTPVVVVDPNLTVPLQTAIANLVNNGVNKPFTVTGTIDKSTQATKIPLIPITGSGTLTVGSPTSATIGGTPALQSTSVITGTISANGVTSSISGTSNSFFNTSNYTTIATIAGGKTMIFSPYTVPSAVKAGSTGSFGNGSDGQQVGPTTSTTAFSVSSDSATTLLLTLVQTTSSLSGGTQAQSVYRVSTTGAISPVSITTQLSFLGSVYEVLTFAF